MARSRKAKKKRNVRSRTAAETKATKRKRRALARTRAGTRTKKSAPRRSAKKRASTRTSKKKTAARGRRSTKKATRARTAKPAKKRAQRPSAKPKPKKRVARRPPPKKKRAPRKLSGAAWEKKLTAEQRRAIERARRRLETAPAQTNDERRREYARRRAAYERVLRSTNATEASIRARLAIAERRRLDVRNLRDGLVGVALDAAGYKGDWRVLNNLQKNLDPSFVEFIAQIESMGYDADTAIDFWYSPEALE